MLDLGRENHFRFDLEQIIESSPVAEERQKALWQAIVTRATRQGIPTTKDYLHEKRDEEILDEDTHRQILRLLDRYSTYR